MGKTYRRVVRSKPSTSKVQKLILKKRDRIKGKRIERAAYIDPEGIEGRFSGE